MIKFVKIHVTFDLLFGLANAHRMQSYNHSHIMAELAPETHRWGAELIFVASKIAASKQFHSSIFYSFQHNHELWSNTLVSLLARRYDGQTRADEPLSDYSICHMNPKN